MESIKKSFLEIGRLVLLAIVSWLATESIIQVIIDLLFGVDLDPTTKLIISGLITTVLKAIDKGLHEEYKGYENGWLKEKGLVGF